MSSASFYFICVFGLRSIIHLVLGSNPGTVWLEKSVRARLFLAIALSRGAIHTTPSHHHTTPARISALRSHHTRARAHTPLPSSSNDAVGFFCRQTCAADFDEMRMMQQQMGAGAGAPQDPGKAFDAEKENQKITSHSWFVNCPELAARMRCCVGS